MLDGFGCQSYELTKHHGKFVRHGDSDIVNIELNNKKLEQKLVDVEFEKVESEEAFMAPLNLSLCLVNKLHSIQFGYVVNWEQLPVLKSAIRTANLSRSIHTFFCGLELPPLAVLWSLHRTADLGSSNGSFQPW